MTSLLTDQQLDDIETRAAHLYEYEDLPDDVDILTGTDVPALLAEVRRLRYRVAELGEQGPDDRETVSEAAQMYRSLRSAIERTMTDPDRWDGDESEEYHLGRYVEWLAAERAQVRTEELNKAADEMDAHCEQYGVLGVGDRLRRMTASAPAVPSA